MLVAKLASWRQSVHSFRFVPRGVWQVGTTEFVLAFAQAIRRARISEADGPNLLDNYWLTSRITGRCTGWPVAVCWRVCETRFM